MQRSKHKLNLVPIAPVSAYIQELDFKLINSRMRIPPRTDETSKVHTHTVQKHICL